MTLNSQTKTLKLKLSNSQTEKATIDESDKYP